MRPQYQCGICGFFGPEINEIRNHIIKEHLDAVKLLVGQKMIERWIP